MDCVRLWTGGLFGLWTVDYGLWTMTMESLDYGCGLCPSFYHQPGEYRIPYVIHE